MKTDIDVLRTDLNETSQKLQQLSKLQNIQKTRMDRVTQKTRETQRAQEELKELKIKEDLLEAKWAELNKSTDEQLKLIIHLLTVQAATSVPTSGQISEVNKADKSEKNFPVKDKRERKIVVDNMTQEDSEWKKVERKRRKIIYRLNVQGQRREHLSNTVIRNMMEAALKREHLYLRSVRQVRLYLRSVRPATRDYQWEVSISMTCPIELQ